MKYSKPSNTSITATMKQLLVVALAMFIVSCGEKKSDGVNLDELENREGVRYLKGSNSPYTGEFFNFHENQQLLSNTRMLTFNSFTLIAHISLVKSLLDKYPSPLKVFRKSMSF